MLIRRMSSILLAGACFAGAMLGQSTAALAQLMPAPPLAAAMQDIPDNAEVWTIGPADHPMGQIRRWTDAAGVRRSREVWEMRGIGTNIDQSVTFAPDGSVREFFVKADGSESAAPIVTTYTVKDGAYRIEGKGEANQGAWAPNAVYVPGNGTLDAKILLTDSLMKAPGHTLSLVPNGTVSLKPFTSLTVTEAGRSKALTAYKIEGLSETDPIVWLDGDRFFATMAKVPNVAKGWEAVWPQLAKAELSAQLKLDAPLAARIAPKATTPILFRDVRIFDADKLTFRDHVSVLVKDGRIAQVGPATLSAHGAKVIAGRGKTLLPGLWDSHHHFTTNDIGLDDLVHGVTNGKDVGDDPDLLAVRMDAVKSGEMLGPRLVPSMLIDGASPQTAQVGRVATDLPAALSYVREAKARGYVGIKLYGSINPAWVAPMAAEAHRLGLRVHGHVPAGMRPLDAARAGYDEINHLGFVVMQALPQEVVDISNTTQRFLGPGRYAGEIDWKSPAMVAFLDELATRRVAVDTTIAGYETMYTCTAGARSPALENWRNALPTTVERSAVRKACNDMPGMTPAQSAASFAKMLELIGELNKRNIDLLAGTDGSPINVVRDIELFNKAGLTPAQAIATATIVPARLSRLDKVTGSIAVGKDADLILVDGDPSQRLGDLRKVEWVMRDGRLMNGDALRAAAGYTGRPQ